MEGCHGRMPRKDVTEGGSLFKEVCSRQEKKEGGTLSQKEINAWILFVWIDL